MHPRWFRGGDHDVYEVPDGTRQRPKFRALPKTRRRIVDSLEMHDHPRVGENVP